MQQQMQAADQPPSPGAGRSNFKAKEPEVFKGSRRILNDWVNDMRKFLDLSRVHHAERCDTVRQYLYRPLRRWYNKIQKPDSNQQFENVDDLFARLKQRFRDPNKQSDLQGDIRSIRCGKGESIQDYNDRFAEIGEGVENSTECDKLYDYLRGLPEDIRRAVKKEKPGTVDQAMELADEEEQLLKDARGRGGERDRSDAPRRPSAPGQAPGDGPVPMDLNRMSRVYSLSREEVQRHIRENRCFNCHAVGHSARNCQRPRQNHPQQQQQQAYHRNQGGQRNSF
eukprot:Cvel_29465.t1-p1 / transcript=Cvel_29465.t1 / gene=Cvel_29465 / organism=Chromera_velia_CCMP2878 / gene_product=Retrotransposon-derived protein PEG10, putative / transcript_product=Retrotransposon-derived protein PEG10, putative / location=Cvel_scaffold4034:1-844(-) / protein_length=281 / sequence_SO=supercontig / SO=protein_coding / is_pseudo=false